MMRTRLYEEDECKNTFGPTCSQIDQAEAELEFGGIYA
jgi:hypothetical protein